MTGIYCVAASLAEEKEKHTLRTLMTSSVNGLEFFIGSLLPALLLLMIVNVLCVISCRSLLYPRRMDRISLRYSRILPHQLYNRYDFWDLRTKSR